MKYKYGIGVMSLNIVDACIEYANDYDKHLIFIPSRRQVDYCGGYVNNWTTNSFSKYLKDSKILLCRDHGGPSQGLEMDSGLESLSDDCQNLNLIHIDPFKECESIYQAAEKTLFLIKFCSSINPSILYEVGTEEAIFRYEPEELNWFLGFLKTLLRSF